MTDPQKNVLAIIAAAEAISGYGLANKHVKRQVLRALERKHLVRGIFPDGSFAGPSHSRIWSLTPSGIKAMSESETTP